MSTKIIVGLALLVVAVLGVQQCRVDRANKRAYESDLGRVNAEARLDTTRQLHLKTLGDTVSAFQRQILQERQEQDAVDRELRLTRVAIAQLTTSVRRLEARNVSGTTTVRPDSSRETQFLVRDVPYTVDARVVHRSPIDPTLALLNVSLDSARIGARISCGARIGLVRPAHLTLMTPPWLSARLDTISAAPEVCSPPPSRLRRFSLGVTGGYSAVLSGGEIRHGPGGTVGLSYRFW